MRFLVFGAAGMLGHKLWQELARRGDTFGTVRRDATAYGRLRRLGAGRLIGDVDATSDADVERALDTARPDVVFNAVGVVKQRAEAHDPVESITINSLLPHRLAARCAQVGARLVHLSTDCVFSGRRGNYTEDSVPDAHDLYGRSKLLGEVAASGTLTLRTSMIGRELSARLGLVEWFLSQRGGEVRGFRRAIFSGFTTVELARLLADVAERHPRLSGVWQVSAAPISKYDLLCLLNDAFDAGVVVRPDEEFHCDRSLDSTRFRAATGYLPPAWPDMVDELRADSTPYEASRTT